MKKILFVLSFLSLVSFANAGIPEIFKAIGSGDITTLSSYFDENVEVYMEGNQEVLSKTEATEMIKNFLNRNKPKSFVQAHQGASKGKDAQYCIGDLSTINGTFRVYIYLKNTGSSYIIQEIRFDK
ncbi:MAG: DUF4783 domain-containing protein [Saprospiraceae bacterium]|jgi:hypothetical protein|nr:DUF4783 domain-containing protein [Saprospiraceae bacterium]